MLKIVLIIFAAYGLIVVAMYLAQERMLYLPNLPGRALEMTPANAGIDFIDVVIETVDGVTIHGWFVEGETEHVLLFFHGNAGNISHRLDSIRQFVRLGLSVFIVDYRGYGKSEGRPSEAGLYRDADAAWHYLLETRGIDSGDIVLFGRSLGASVAAKLATQQEARGLIVESSFTSVPEIAQELYPWLPVRWLSRIQHATARYIREVQCPVLVVHSRNDEIIPFHHGEAIYEAAPRPRSFLALTGGHNDAFIVDGENYLEGIGQFLDSLGD